ncbi:GNAT family N-acetyltransferase [Paracoccus endophyticus]|uniref:GNAT family N-acetyltransferase n=1 Tax=Paracoccus endophyticus TaxID=2233774 RepID=UPI001F0CA3CF|nr:GNAT family N-acetyltransferase [Paracoccus endophyticus]
MIPADLDAAFQATWPAAEYARAGGLQVGRGLGGGGRVSAARATGHWQPDDIDAAVALQRGWDQPPLIAVGDDDHRLSQALAGRGWQPSRATVLLQAPIAALAGRPVPPVTALPLWPPLAIQRDLWTQMDVGPSRQAVMDRVAGPKWAILGRIEDRAAGCAFVAVAGRIAMLHALVVVPWLRRRGLAGWMTCRAASLGAGAGAEALALAVLRDNAPALALYAALGFSPVGGYAYWTPAGD